MQSALERINYPLVFSHNDLLIYNSEYLLYILHCKFGSLFI